MDFFTKNKTKFELADVGKAETAVAVFMMGTLADQLEQLKHEGAAIVIRQMATAVVQIEQGRKR